MAGKGQWYDLKLREVDPQFVNDAAEHVKGGATVKQTARMMGVPPGTFKAWLRTGAEQVLEAYETGEQKHMLEREAALFLAVEKAAGQRAKTLIDEIRGAAKDDEWRARTWLLERYESEDFGDTKRVELTGADGGKIAVDHPDVAQAIERFTAAVVSLADRSRADGAAALAAAGGESGPGLPVARLDSEAEPART